MCLCIAVKLVSKVKGRRVITE